MPEPEIRYVTLWLCDLCLDGKGGECHMPGCALWMNRAPDMPIRDKTAPCANHTTHLEWGVRNHEGYVGLHANEHSARETYQRQRDHVFPPQGLIRRTVTTLYSEWEAVEDE